MIDGYDYNVGLSFARCARRVADRVALIYPSSHHVSYRELDERSNRLASYIKAQGVARHDTIAIVHAKTPDCFALMLACLKLGAIYVNIDDLNPPARLAHIFAQARPKLTFGHALSDAVRMVSRDHQALVIDLDEFGTREAIALGDSTLPPETAEVTGSAPAYIMFTSGSTGVPKGALISHANVLNLAAWARVRFCLTTSDVLSNVNPMYFDNSVFDFFAALLNGAGLVPIERKMISEPATLLACLEAAGCTVWFSVPSLLVYLATLKLLTPERLGALRAFVFGGEGFPKMELRKLFATYSGRVRFINVYGPTECTCICSAWDVTEIDFADPAKLVTLGPVAENFSMLVLDRDGRRVAPGEVGELHLLGPQVGLGYVNDVERTRRAFRRNPLQPRWPQTMYATGDLVRLGADGARLDYVGRIDNQVKHLGYRIELEEIEAAINGIIGVMSSVVVQTVTRRSITHLVAYVASTTSTEPEAILDRLRTLLPSYMIPQRVEIRSELPKNANGKIDRSAVAAWETT